MSIPFEIRRITEPEALEAVVDLEIAVWGMQSRDAVPMNLMRPIVLHGGLALGAYSAEKLVGAALALPLRHDNRWVLWSHTTGVCPDFQARGIGFELKQAQRSWALENGFSEIRWTFDPLQRGNANFNLHTLGATANTYHVAYYGLMDDTINRGGVSDRIEASWKLKSPRVKALAHRKSSAPVPDPRQRGVPVLAPDANGVPVMNDHLAVTAPVRLVAIPRHRASRTTAEMDAWRSALRDALQSAFSLGYSAVDFVDEEDYGWYVVQAPPTWYLYVLRCADNTLYTGITPDLSARLARHQSGKGAAYTATRRPVEMIGAWAFTGRSQVLKAEIAFKQQTRATKLSRVLRRDSFLGVPFIDPPATS